MIVDSTPVQLTPVQAVDEDILRLPTVTKIDENICKLKFSAEPESPELTLAAIDTDDDDLLLYV